MGEGRNHRIIFSGEQTEASYLVVGKPLKTETKGRRNHSKSEEVTLLSLEVEKCTEADLKSRSTNNSKPSCDELAQ